MSVHDWTRVDAGIFHHFHHAWIEELSRALNAGILPTDYYALSEQHAAGLGPDVRTLQAPADEEGQQHVGPSEPTGAVSLLVSPPQVEITAETEMEFCRRKQSAVVVRHVSGDRIVAVGIRHPRSTTP